MKPLILLAEDETAIRSALTLVLSREGYRVLEASSGDEAVRLACEHLPDAVLMDLAMPGLNGLDAAQLLKQKPDTSAIPLIAITASWLARDLNTLLSAGFHGAVLKPFTPPVLLAELERVLSSHPAGS